MKKIIAAVLALCFFVSAGFGQSDEIRPAAIGVSFFMNDFKTPDRIRTTSLSAVIRDKQWAKPSEMSPGLAVSYFKGLHRHIDFATTLGISFVKYPLEKHTFSTEKALLELDAAMNFKMVSERFWVQPYAILGVGAHMYGGKYFGAYIPTGLGLKVNFYDDAHFFATAQYKIPVLKEYTNYHLVYQVGIAGRIGKKAEPKIIPPPPPPPPPPPVDTDKDGINDEEDKCPTAPGLARYQGCPIPDTDKDGINDEEDKCPTEAGPASNQGCPISEEVIKKVNYAAENILFATNKYVLLGKSFKGLDEVAQILKDDPQLKISIDGHTDNVGKDDFNHKLSENRAKAVKNYLVKKGVDESRIKVIGYGETVPVADNKTAEGRKQNRRVELKLSY